MRRRLLTILAVTALGVTALVGAAPAIADEPVQPGAPYVAIGDSVASGNGLMPYYDAACLRSKKAYPTVLAGMLGVGVVSAACTGSPILAVAGQAVDLAAHGVLGAGTGLVTITASVNDLQWIGVLALCSNLGTPVACHDALDGIGGAAPVISDGVAQLVGLVRRLAPNAQIVVTGYPLVFGPFSGTCSVGHSVQVGTPMKFAQPQATWINGGVIGLNGAIEDSLDLYQAGFFAQTGYLDPAVRYVDVTTAFTHHSLCDSGDKWISALVSGQPKDRGFHPNVAGQQAYAAAIFAALPH